MFKKSMVLLVVTLATCGCYSGPVSPAMSCERDCMNKHGRCFPTDDRLVMTSCLSYDVCTRQCMRDAFEERQGRRETRNR